ncbi:MAG: YHS domain-containing protein [Candidatus Aminicenantaceae bacterium]
MLTGIVKILFYVLVGYIIYLAIRFFNALSKASKRKPSNSQKPVSGTMVKDIICNTYIPKEEALKETRNGKEYFFCSEKCRQKFLEENSSK